MVPRDKTTLRSAANALLRAAEAIHDATEGVSVNSRCESAAKAEIHLALLLLKEVLGEDNDNH